jgi:hypothetical protein
VDRDLRACLAGGDHVEPTVAVDVAELRVLDAGDRRADGERVPVHGVVPAARRADRDRRGLALFPARGEIHVAVAVDVRSIVAVATGVRLRDRVTRPGDQRIEHAWRRRVDRRVGRRHVGRRCVRREPGVVVEHHRGGVRARDEEPADDHRN